MAPNSTEHKNMHSIDENDNENNQLIRRKENEGEFIFKTSTKKRLFYEMFLN